jgi:hypothetical protein
LRREFVAPSLVYVLYTSLGAPAHAAKSIARYWSFSAFAAVVKAVCASALLAKALRALDSAWVFCFSPGTVGAHQAHPAQGVIGIGLQPRRHHEPELRSGRACCQATMKKW